MLVIVSSADLFFVHPIYNSVVSVLAVCGGDLFNFGMKFNETGDKTFVGSAWAVFKVFIPVRKTII